MSDPWIPLLTSLPLSRTEREVVKRFESDPHGRTFLPVADILRSHRLTDESLELLTQGVERHPGFAIARVVLARELLQKGLIEEGWRVLESSPVALRENILAQKLRFRLTLLLSLESVARATWQHMQVQQMVDADTKRVGELMDVSGFDAARSKLLKDMTDRGVEPVLPAQPKTTPEVAQSTSQPGASAGTGGQSGPESGAGRDVRIASVSTSGSSSYMRSDQLDDDTATSGFHVIPLGEIFRPTDEAASAQRRAGTAGGGPGNGGVELDSTTLADIYERQGHYAKALAVYRRLVRITPGNDLLRRKVGELIKLDREQRDVDLTVDPSVVDRMEEVEIIDRQIRFYNDLLSRIT